MNHLGKALSSLESTTWRKNVFILFSILLFTLGCIGLCKISEGEQGSAAVFKGLPSSISATYSLLNGEAKTYDRELNERDQYLTTATETNIVLEPLTATPDIIFHTDITTNPSFWKNTHLALYYNKSYIKLSR